MAERCVWLIGLGDVDRVAQQVAAQLRPYGTPVRGQKWPSGEKQPWLASAQEAAGAGARVVVVVAQPESYANPERRRELALFRLLLQSLNKTTVNGFVVLTDLAAATTLDSDLPGTAVLADWEKVTDTGWPARVVARMHAPRKPQWPARIGMYAQEKLGVWLEVKPSPDSTTQGCLLGVSGHSASISFHAVGPAGRLPERSVNEYELKGIEFEAAGHAFSAWALRNTLTPADAYFVRIEQEPDILAIGNLPDGEFDDVDLLNLR